MISEKKAKRAILGLVLIVLGGFILSVSIVIIDSKVNLLPEVKGLNMLGLTLIGCIQITGWAIVLHMRYQFLKGGN